ncbi:MAG TPA: zf-TFIIB domain-containing protein [Bradyrhizobium sp.]|uniref:zf-TFIIB domain-containing protein n=1 Tax=Bradyrhizobium sp. TaxID=376 RepID=UPI002B459793|nr:zf-TFIIB domain-containing protein [Bradyrhizobium sp.]HKO73233.1 zf-TFIIB domain-containing protein [Bradyrhizobium sp.]
MSSLENQPIPLPSAKVRCKCPECNASLAILRVIAGKAGSEYWTMRCTRCGGIHLDIVKSSTIPVPCDAPVTS